MRQQVMFTACPRDRVGDGLRLSVFVSPRLDPQDDDQVLGTFPDFLDWPATVAAMSWEVLLNGTPNAAVVDSDPPSSTLWTGLFNADTFVRPPEYPDYGSHLWFSYPAANLAGFVEDLYQSIATDFPTEFPHVDDLAGTGIPEMAHLNTAGGDNRDVLRRNLVNALQEDDARALAPGPLAVAFDSFQLWNFHQPGNLAIGVEEPEFDFHEVVGFCSEHFGLLRRLGLVVDLIIPEPSIGDGGTTAQLVPTWTPQAGDDHVDVRPITRALIQPNAFVAGPRPGAPEIVDGQLPLEGTSYRAVQVDVDGAVLNLITLARNLHQAGQHTSLDTPEHESLPRLRSAGISIVRTGQAQALVHRVDTGAELHAAREAGDDVVLYAEDLWRGTRYDVLDDSGQWHSLQYREGDYDFISAPATESISEEAVVIETPSSRDEDDPEADEQFLYQGESLMKWEGWSLAAPRPGRTLDSHDQVTDAPNDPPDGFPLVMNFAATPGTLPRLRFGNRYRIRARTVDIAGNSLPPDSTDTTHATDRITYGRYEPVPAPYVLGRLFNGPGESVEHVVLRSNFDTPPDVAAERHIAPPRTAQRPAEEYGMYDTAAGLDPNGYAGIVAREAESFADPNYGGGISQPDPNHADQPVFPVAPLPILYLPDPPGRGVSFHRETDDEILVAFDRGDWPNYVPVRLVVEEGNGEVSVVEADEEGIVTVGLPKAERLRVPYSCYVNADDLDVSAIWRLMITKAGVTDTQIKEWRDLAERGRLWMITPFRALTLVHAVRQPLKPAEFAAPGTPGRPAGATHAFTSVAMTFSRKSTSRVDWRGRWTDLIDRGTGGGAAADDPFDMDREQWLEVRIPGIDIDPDQLPVNQRHEFGDTKRHIVTYRAFATSSFTEYFNADDFPDEDRPFTRESSEDIVVDYPSSARPQAPKVLYVVPTHEWAQGGGGLSLSSEGKGGGLRVYLDRPFFGSGVGQLVGVVLAPNPNTIGDALSSYVTRWGFDPIRSSGPLPAPAPGPQHFPIATETGTGVLDENGASVDIAGHEVGFDTDRKLWYCDIQMDAGDADWPFVRLALASFQPNSLPGLHISRVILAEFIQLTPDRSASIGLAGGPGSREMQLSFVAPLPSSDAPSTEVTARLERHLPDVDDELLGWEQVNGGQTDTELEPATGSGDRNVTWTGTLQLPPFNRPGHDRLRVVIEQWQIAERVPAGADGGSAPRAQSKQEQRRQDAILRNLEGIPGVGRGRRDDDDDRVARRLVFQDVIDVSSLRQPGVGT
jgi:hypothetical protein